MAERVEEHLYKLKGGEQEAVEAANPLLERREPLVIYGKDGKTRIKIGDGKHPANDLPYIGNTDNNFTDELKEKLEGIENGANKVIVDNELSETSTNAISNKVVTTEFTKVKKEINSSVANAIKGVVFGNPIHLTEHSPIEHNMIVKGFGEEVLYTTNGGYILDGDLQFEDEGDDVEMYLTVDYSNVHYSEDEGLWEVTIYFVGGGWSLVSELAQEPPHLSHGTMMVYRGTENGEDLYYLKNNVVQITKYDKNYLSYPRTGTSIQIGEQKTSNGVTFVDNGDGTIVAIDGKSTSTKCGITIWQGNLVLPKGKYTFYGFNDLSFKDNRSTKTDPAIFIKCTAYSKKGNPSTIISDREKQMDFELLADSTNVTIYLRVNPGVEVNNQKFYCYLFNKDDGKIYNVNASGAEVISSYPELFLLSDEGNKIEVEYNRDLDKAFNEQQKTIEVLKTDVDRHESDISTLTSKLQGLSFEPIGTTSGTYCRLSDVSPYEQEVKVSSVQRVTDKYLGSTEFSYTNIYEEGCYKILGIEQEDDPNWVLCKLIFEGDKYFSIDITNELSYDSFDEFVNDCGIEIGSIVKVCARQLDPEHDPDWVEMRIYTTRMSKVTRYGGNMFDPTKWEKGDGNMFGKTVQNGDVFTTEFTSTNDHLITTQTFKPGKYTITIFPEGKISFGLRIRRADRKTAVLYTSTSYKNTTVARSFTVNIDSEFVIAINGVSGTYGTFSYKIQVEAGTYTDSASKPFNSYAGLDEYEPDENGKVSGITSFYPTTTIFTEPDTTITVQYNKDITKSLEGLVQAIISLGGNV